MDAELKRATDEVAEFAAAAKALLTTYETKLAKAVNDLELAKNRSTDHEGQIRKTLDAISRSGQELARQQRELVAEIQRSWAIRVDETAGRAGAEQAKLFGAGITSGLLEKLDPFTKRIEALTRTFRWQSALKWGVAIGLAIPVTIGIGLWALLPSVAGVSGDQVRTAVQQLQTCKVGTEPHVCVRIDAKAKVVTTPGGDVLTVVRGL